jgi:hypothetical protein
MKSEGQEKAAAIEAERLRTQQATDDRERESEERASFLKLKDAIQRIATRCSIGPKVYGLGIVPLVLSDRYRDDAVGPVLTMAGAKVTLISEPDAVEAMKFRLFEGNYNYTLTQIQRERNQQDPYPATGATFVAVMPQIAGVKKVWFGFTLKKDQSLSWTTNEVEFETGKCRTIYPVFLP